MQSETKCKDRRAVDTPEGQSLSKESTGRGSRGEKEGDKQTDKTVNETLVSHHRMHCERAAGKQKWGKPGERGERSNEDIWASGRGEEGKIQQGEEEGQSRHSSPLSPLLSPPSSSFVHLITGWILSPSLAPPKLICPFMICQKTKQTHLSSILFQPTLSPPSLCISFLVSQSSVKTLHVCIYRICFTPSLPSPIRPSFLSSLSLCV